MKNSVSKSVFALAGLLGGASAAFSTSPIGPISVPATYPQVNCELFVNYTDVSGVTIFASDLGLAAGDLHQTVAVNPNVVGANGNLQGFAYDVSLQPIFAADGGPKADGIYDFSITLGYGKVQSTGGTTIATNAESKRLYYNLGKFSVQQNGVVVEAGIHANCDVNF